MPILVSVRLSRFRPSSAPFTRRADLPFGAVVVELDIGMRDETD